jgi:hypothetical protein
VYMTPFSLAWVIVSFSFASISVLVTLVSRLAGTKARWTYRRTDSGQSIFVLLGSWAAGGGEVTVGARLAALGEGEWEGP